MCRNTEAKNQHWVPQFYLKAFAIPNSASKSKQIYALPKWGTRDGKEFRTAIRNVAARRFLYSPVGDSGERDHSFDKSQTELETLLAKILKDLQSGCVSLTGSYRKGIALLVANLYLRNIRQRAFAIGLQNKLHAMLKEAFDGTDDHTVKLVGEKTGAVVEFSRYEFELAQQGNLDADQLFVSFIRDNMGTLAQALIDRRWNVIVSPQGKFITSDNPVILSGPKHERFGFGSPESTIHLPLTPGKLLVVDSKDGPENNYREICPWKGDVAPHESGFNFQSYGNAYRFAFGPSSLYRVLEDGIAFCENLRAYLTTVCKR